MDIVFSNSVNYEENDTTRLPRQFPHFPKLYPPDLKE